MLLTFSRCKRFNNENKNSTGLGIRAELMVEWIAGGFLYRRTFSVENRASADWSVFSNAIPAITATKTAVIVPIQNDFMSPSLVT